MTFLIDFCLLFVSGECWGGLYQKFELSRSEGIRGENEAV